MKKIVPFLGCGSKSKKKVEPKMEPEVPKDDLAMLLEMKFQEGYVAALNDFIQEMKKVRSNMVLMGVAPAVQVMQLRVQKMKEAERGLR